MYNILLDLLYRGANVELSSAQVLSITIGAIVLVLLAFCFISIALYRLMLYIIKF